MFEILRKPLSNREWLVLGILQGACGSAVLLVAGVLLALVQAAWLEALTLPLLLPLMMLCALVNAVLGIPAYRWLVKQVALADASAPQEGGSAA